MNITFRHYEKDDLSRCAELSVDAWPIISLIAKKENVTPIMQIYVKLSLALSNYTEICCDNDKVVGFLLGSIGKTCVSKKEKQENRMMLWKFITGKFGGINRRFRFISAFILSTIKVELLGARFDGEVVLFVVDGAYRGQGIGRTLLDHFLNYARERKFKTIYLSTDVESNWSFYEKYGFKKYRDFYDNGLSVMKGKKTNSFIYYYEL